MAERFDICEDNEVFLYSEDGRVGLFYNDRHGFDITIDAAKAHALIEWLTERFGLPWISVEDRLPEEAQRVDVWCGHGAWKGSIFHMGVFTGGSGTVLEGVTHWMPQRKLEGPRC